MFEFFIRLYREAATILKLMDEKKGSVRSLTFSKQLKIRNKAVYPLVHKTLSSMCVLYYTLCFFMVWYTVGKQEVLDIIEKSAILKKVPKVTIPHRTGLETPHVS